MAWLRIMFVHAGKVVMTMQAPPAALAPVVHSAWWVAAPHAVKQLLYPMCSPHGRRPERRLVPGVCVQHAAGGGLLAGRRGGWARACGSDRSEPCDTGGCRAEVRQCTAKSRLLHCCDVAQETEAKQAHNLDFQEGKIKAEVGAGDQRFALRDVCSDQPCCLF